MSTAARSVADLDFAERCLEGDHAAIRELQERFGAYTSAFLIHAGAAPSEARELVCSLWAELLMGLKGKPPCLRRYRGGCALQTWLNTVALNKLISLKRREKRWRDLIPASLTAASPDESESREPAWFADSECAQPGEAPLLEIMRVAIETAFTKMDAQDFVLLNLAHIDGLQGKELARIFGWNAGYLSRRLRQARERIAAATLAHVRCRDPWLELKWEDFVDLCRSATPHCFGTA